MLKLYNTLTRRVEDFIPISKTEVGYYSCGPTVYDFAHIGHARTYVFADIVERILRMNGFMVKRVMNITDVGHLTSDSDVGEDKMEKGAKREGKTVWEIAQFYTTDFFEMLQKLKIIKPPYVTKATDYIPQMIDLISRLEKKGFTYMLEDGLYFDTSKLPDYGKLTGASFEKLQKMLKAGARVEMVSGKKNITDFALWKKSPEGAVRQMEWKSPWGKGFPGWHIECSAMSMEQLGETFDIHTGGIDHIPVHHTNEIAQSEAATDKKFVNYWLHASHLLVDGQKMSKSLKNFYRVTDIEAKGFSSLALRYLFLSASYRSDMNFTWEALSGAQNAYANLLKHMQEIRLAQTQNGASPETHYSSDFEHLKKEFVDALNNDMNTAIALSVVWKTIKSTLSFAEKYTLLKFFDTVLGLGINDIEISIPDNVKKLNEVRNAYRRDKNFQEADKLKKEIDTLGFEVKDTPTGTILQKK